MRGHGQVHRYCAHMAALPEMLTPVHAYAAGPVTELCVTDLRFTSIEASGFLYAMSRGLKAEDVAALEERTVGWIAVIIQQGKILAFIQMWEEPLSRLLLWRALPQDT